MQLLRPRVLWALSLSSLLVLLGGCVSASSPDPVGKREQAYKHPLPPGPPYAFYLTTFGAGSDAQNTSCGKWVDGTWWYSTGVYHWGCGAKLEVRANGKCGVVEVTDNGPADWVEANAAGKCNGVGGVINGYILDVSPLLAQHLFGVSSGGWSDCYAIMVTPVDKATPTGPCQTTGPVCGDNTVDPGETCDPPSSCPTSCDDADSCTADALQGSAAQCTALCQHTPITACLGGDGCCPTGCSFANDSDCTPAADSGPGPADAASPRDTSSPLPDSTSTKRDSGQPPSGDAAPPVKPPTKPNNGLAGGCALVGAEPQAAPLLSLLSLLALAFFWRRRSF